ncbi:hypothetical protein ACHAP1_008006 [Verticillium nonalfalfae]
MDDELERVKKEYEERQRKKKEREDKEKSEDSDKDKDKSKDKSKHSGDNPETTKIAKIVSRNFFALRIEKKRQIELAKRNRERIAQPNFFPSVPKGAPNGG